MRNRVALLGAATLAVLALALYLYGLGGLNAGGPIAAGGSIGATGPAGSPAPRTDPTDPAPPAIPALPTPLLRAAPVTLDAVGFWSWSLVDRRSGEISGSANQNVANGTASMIKAWLAADYLRQAAEKNTKPSNPTMNRLSTMIRDSDNAAASYVWRLNGGSASITRLIRICGLTDSKAYLDWAHTLLSARDAARMGACIGDGRAAGPKWTEWVLKEMRSVRGVGRFGIISALPVDNARQTAIKNGWIARSDGKWHVNCMAVAPDWALGIMLVYPAAKGLGYGAGLCASVTEQLMAEPE